MLTLLSFFMLIRSPYFAVKLMFVAGVEVHVETYRVSRVLTRCSCVVIPLSTLLSRRVRPAFRSEQTRPRLKGSPAFRSEQARPRLNGSPAFRSEQARPRLKGSPAFRSEQARPRLKGSPAFRSKQARPR